MIKIALMLASIIWVSSTAAQQQEQLPPCGFAGGIPAKFNQEDFLGRFAVMVQQEGEYNYFVTDLSQLQERFEKIYFLNLAYTESRLISVDSDISKDQLWFKAHRQYEESEITEILEILKKNSHKAFITMSEADRSSWLNKFDKFKSSGTDE